MDEFGRLKANIYKVYILKFFSMFLVIMPIIVPYLESLELGMFDIYLLQSIFAVGVVIFEVPSGYISDLLGRKNTLVVGGFLYGLAYVIFVLSDSFWGFALFEISAAFASSFFPMTRLVEKRLSFMAKMES
jgi:MFS family permease